MATVHTGTATATAPFDFTNNTGTNVRLVILYAKGADNEDGGTIEWGDFGVERVLPDRPAAGKTGIIGDNWASAETTNVNTCIKKFNTRNHKGWEHFGSMGFANPSHGIDENWQTNAFGRYALYNDLASYKYNDIRGQDAAREERNIEDQLATWAWLDTTYANTDELVKKPNKHRVTIGIPCEYYLAPGHRFVLKDFGGDTEYSILQIDGVPGTVYTGRGNWSYTNTTGQNVRIITQYLRDDFDVSFSWGDHREVSMDLEARDTGSNSRSWGQFLPADVIQFGWGKYSIANNSKCNPYIKRWWPMKSYYKNKYMAPDEMWLASDHIAALAVDNTQTMASRGYDHVDHLAADTVSNFSFLVMPEDGT